MKKEVKRMQPETANFLLSPSTQTGKSEGRVGTFMLAIFIIVAPPILLGSLIIGLVMAFGTWLLWIIIPLYIYYIWRVVAKLLLHEKERLARFKKEQISKYQSLEELTTVKRIHSDGAVEYINGQVSYFILCKNGNKSEPLQRAPSIERFLMTLQHFTVSIYLLNIVDSSTLSNRYSSISAYENKTIAKNMFEMINYNKKYVEDNSLVTYTIFEIKSVFSDKQLIKGTITDAIGLLTNRIYREVIIADDDLANYILNRTLCTNVDYKSLFMKRNAKGVYYKNKILGYDMEYEEVQTQTEQKGEEDLPWIPKL